MAFICRSRSVLAWARALVFSSGVSLRPGVAAAGRLRPLVVDPVMDRYRLASAWLRLGVGRPLPVCAGGLLLGGAFGGCVPWESWAWPSVAPALLRRNTGIAYCGGATPLHPPRMGGGSPPYPPAG